MNPFFIKQIYLVSLFFVGLKELYTPYSKVLNRIGMIQQNCLFGGFFYMSLSKELKFFAGLCFFGFFCSGMSFL